MKKQVFLTLLFLLVYGIVNAQIIGIKAGKVIDPATGRILNNQIILVENGRIKELGSDVIIPQGTEIIDLSTSIVMPGLIDAHTQRTMRDGACKYAINVLRSKNEESEADFSRSVPPLHEPRPWPRKDTFR